MRLLEHGTGFVLLLFGGMCFVVSVIVAVLSFDARHGTIHLGAGSLVQGLESVTRSSGLMDYGFLQRLPDSRTGRHRLCRLFRRSSDKS